MNKTVAFITLALAFVLAGCNTVRVWAKTLNAQATPLGRAAK